MLHLPVLNTGSQESIWRRFAVNSFSSQWIETHYYQFTDT